MSTSLRNIAIAAGGVAEDILPERLGRTSVVIKPITEDCWVNFGETAAVDNGWLVEFDSPAADGKEFHVKKFPEVGGKVSVFSATTGAKILVQEV